MAECKGTPSFPRPSLSKDCTGLSGSPTPLHSSNAKQGALLPQPSGVSHARLDACFVMPYRALLELLLFSKAANCAAVGWLLNQLVILEPCNSISGYLFTFFDCEFVAEVVPWCCTTCDGNGGNGIHCGLGNVGVVEGRGGTEE